LADTKAQQRSSQEISDFLMPVPWPFR